MPKVDLTLTNILGAVISIITVIGFLWHAASVWGAHEELVRQQEVQIKQLQQIISITHSDTATAFGINRSE